MQVFNSSGNCRFWVIGIIFFNKLFLMDSKNCLILVILNNQRTGGVLGRFFDFFKSWRTMVMYQNWVF